MAVVAPSSSSSTATDDVERWYYPAFCTACGETWEAGETHEPCPTCGDAHDAAYGPLTGVLSQDGDGA